MQENLTMNIHGLKKQKQETTQKLKAYLKLPRKEQSNQTIKNMHSKIRRLNEEIKRRKQDNVQKQEKQNTA